MKKIVFFLMAIVVMLSIIPVSWTAVYADDGVSLARKSAQIYITGRSSVGNLYNNWKTAKPDFVRKVNNSENMEIGYIFLIKANNKDVGHIFVGNSLYDYDVLEAGLSTNMDDIDRTVSGLIPIMSTSEQYHKDRINNGFATEGTLTMATTGGQCLLVPRHQQPTGTSCAPTSGAMVMEYWKQYRECPNLPGWQTDYYQLYATMHTDQYVAGTRPQDIGPGIVQFAQTNGYSFSYQYRYYSVTTFTVVMNEINASRPIMLGIDNWFGNPHEFALIGYYQSSGNYITVNDPLDGTTKDLNWALNYQHFDSDTIWKN